MTFRAIDIGSRVPAAVDPGPAPDLRWLLLSTLVIDERYQRPLGPANWRQIEAIAAAFQWARFAPILVAPSGSNSFAVIDGQHRVHAAQLCGLTAIPAAVVDVPVLDQARAFTWVNRQAIRVNHWEVYKAALAAGEDWALRAEAAVSAANCRLMTRNSPSSEKQAGQIYAVAFIRKMIEQNLDWAITAALQALVMVPALQRPASYTDYLIKPWILATADSGCRVPQVLARVLQADNPFKVIERAGGFAGGRHGLRALIARAEIGE